MAESFTPTNFDDGQDKDVTISGNADLTHYSISSVDYLENSTGGKNTWTHSKLKVDPGDNTKGTTKLKAKKVKKAGPKKTVEDGTLTINMTNGTSPLTPTEPVTVSG